MYYLYFIDNFGRASLEVKSTKKEDITKEIKNVLKILDPDTKRHLIITTKELPIQKDLILKDIKIQKEEI